MEQALGEYEVSRSVFGVREQKFYRNLSGLRMTRHDVSIDSPIGPAAGPHSQLAENIVAAFLAGCRFIELKTVQTMDGDELRACVARPCINATDECYNVEWSTELTVQQALEEYIRAWFAVHVLGTEFDLGTKVIFNMSVGYSLEGIQSKKIDDYLEGMRDASSTAAWTECTAWLQANLERFSVFGVDDLAAIPTQVSNSVTLSTLHGCPANEIERIAHYLLTVKELHTNIKCNPTLLGYPEARRILDEMGYGYIAFDDHHFVEDLQFDDAVAMIGRLQAKAAQLALDFGVKITNTFPVDIKRNELPGEEMYMSGRALFPLSLNVANRLSRAFDGRLQISYSGGVDAFNIERLLKTGIRPITMATTLLKPGGYERVPQLATLAEGALDPAQSKLDVALLDSLAAGVVSFARHRKDHRETDSHKSDVALPLFDCADAPCSATGCPINQQIPAYLEQVARGEYERAFAIIANDNVLPSVTATICDHQCQTRCTRLDYDDPLQIRSAKKAASLAAQQAYTEALTRPPALRSTAKVLVIGAGPAGLAAASYLRRNGVDVTVHEARAKPLGIVSHIIPAFRISEPELALDVELARAYGVDFEFSVPADYDLAALKSRYDYIILATGAWKEGRSDIPLDGVKVIDALDFLARSRASGLKLELGERVAVIGGGDVAMDCARAAARNEGVREATIVYRRTRDFMPAQREEIELALTDGVRIVELHAPHSFEDGALICDIMELGETDASGRRSVRACGRTARLGFDTIISAVGAGVDSSLFAKNGLALDERGHALLNDNRESSLPGIYLAGDCKAGPKTVVKAMADAKTIATDILAKLGLENDFRVFAPEACRDELLEKKGVLIAAEPNCGHASHDAVRCLACGQVCEVCVDVCPNRANVSIEIGEESGTGPAHLTQRHQILHLDGLCNECGNCGIFCPTAGNPYLDKFTLFMCEEDFAESANRGFLPLGDKRYRIRLEDGGIIESSLDDELVPAAVAALMRSAGERYSYLLRPDAACFDPSIGADARIGTRG
jgi:putative selenate reductase